MTRKGNRFSSLPIAQFCPKAPGLNVGAGRAAAIGTAFHAFAAQEDGWEDKLARLTEEERNEVKTMKKPGPFEVENGNLIYEEARKEMPCGITEGGAWCEKDDPEAIAYGTADMVWIWNASETMSILYLGDIKRSEWTSSPDSLQLLGYAFAFAEMWNCTHICCGIWDATGGQWSWGPLIDLESEEGVMAWKTVKAAAMNIDTPDNDYCTGPHCQEMCYGRQQCPAFLLPPEMAETSLAPFTKGGIIDNAKALHVRQLFERATTTLEVIKEALKAYAKTTPIVDEATGKQWSSGPVKGRASLDSKALEVAHPEIVEKFIRIGKPSTQFRWRNIK